MWFKLRDEYIKSMKNYRKISKLDSNYENVIDDFKYKREMAFLSLHIAHSSSSSFSYYEIPNSSNDYSAKESTMDLKENSSDSADENFEIKSNISISSTENDLSELTDEIDGEIIMDLGDDELIAIPAQIINDNDCNSYKDDIIVNIKPKSKSFNISDDYIPIELEIEGSNDPQVRIPYNEIFNLLNLNEELNLEIDSEPSNESNIDDVIGLKPKKIHNEMADEDPTSEEFFYKTLALTANNIECIKQRFELRQKVSKCVMEAVRKYYLEKEHDNGR